MSVLREDGGQSVFHPIAAIVILVMLVMFSFAVFVALKGSAGRRQFRDGNYPKAIRNANRMLRIYCRTGRLLRWQNSVATIDHLYFMLAVSYFATGHDEMCLKSIHARSRMDDTGRFWLALHGLQKHAPVLAQEYVAETSGLGDKQLYKTFLEGLLADRDGDSELARSKLQEVYRRIDLPILKQIADEILKKA